MWQYRPRISFLLVASLFLLLFVSHPLPGESYLITKSELTQIKKELQTLRLELSILKANSEADAIALIKLSEKAKNLNDSISKLQMNLTDTESALTLAQVQLGEAQTQLKELKASLDKSKRAELWNNIKIGGICIGIGTAVGIIIGISIGS